jgi:hypothetical protein
MTAQVLFACLIAVALWQGLTAIREAVRTTVRR